METVSIVTHALIILIGVIAIGAFSYAILYAGKNKNIKA